MVARLPKDLSSLPKRPATRRYFVRDAEARAEPRRWVQHHQIVPLLQGSIVSALGRCHTKTRLGVRIGVADETAAIGQPLCLSHQVFREPRPTNTASLHHSPAQLPGFPCSPDHRNR
jgi:hypothetical protein